MTQLTDEINDLSQERSGTSLSSRLKIINQRLDIDIKSILDEKDEKSALDQKSILLEKEIGGKIVSYLLRYSQKNYSDNENLSIENNLKFEYLANQIYKLFGVKVPSYEIGKLDDGRIISISRFVESKGDPLKPDISPSNTDLQSGVVLDSLLGNFGPIVNPMSIINSEKGILRAGNCLNLVPNTGYYSYLTNPLTQIEMFRDMHHPNWEVIGLSPYLECQISSEDIYNQVKNLSEILTDKKIDELLLFCELESDVKAKLKSILIERRDILKSTFILSEDSLGDIQTLFSEVNLNFDLDYLSHEQILEIKNSRFYSMFLKSTPEEKLKFRESSLELFQSLNTEENLNIEQILYTFSKYENFESITDIPVELSIFYYNEGSESLLKILNSISRQLCKKIILSDKETINSISIFYYNQSDIQDNELLINNILSLQELKNDDLEDSLEYFYQIPGINKFIVNSTNQELIDIVQTFNNFGEDTFYIISILNNTSYFDPELILEKEYLVSKVKNLNEFLKKLPLNSRFRNFTLKFLGGVDFKFDLNSEDFNFAEIAEYLKSNYNYDKVSTAEDFDDLNSIFSLVDEEDILKNEVFSVLVKNENQLKEFLTNKIYFSSFDEGKIFDLDFLRSEEAQFIDIYSIKIFLEFFSTLNIEKNFNISSSEDLLLLRSFISKNIEPNLIIFIFQNKFNSDAKLAILNEKDKTKKIEILVENFFFNNYSEVPDSLVSNLKITDFKKFLLSLGSYTNEEIFDIDNLIRKYLKKYIYNYINNFQIDSLYNQNSDGFAMELDAEDYNFLVYFCENLELYPTENLESVFAEYSLLKHHITLFVSDFNYEDVDFDKSSLLVDSLVSLYSNFKDNDSYPVLFDNDSLRNLLLPKMLELRKSKEQINVSELLSSLLEDQEDDEYIKNVYHSFFKFIKVSDKSFAELFLSRNDVFSIFLCESLYDNSVSPNFNSFIRVGIGSFLTDSLENLPDIELPENKRIEIVNLIIQNLNYQSFFKIHDLSGNFNDIDFIYLLKIIKSDSLYIGDINSESYYEQIIKKYLHTNNVFDLEINNNLIFFNEFIGALPKEKEEDRELILRVINYLMSNISFLHTIKNIKLNQINFILDTLSQYSLDTQKIVEEFLISLDSILNASTSSKIYAPSLIKILNRIDIQQLINSEEFQQIRLSLSKKINLSSAYYLKDGELILLGEIFDIKNDLEIFYLLKDSNSKLVMERQEFLSNLAFESDNPVEAVKTYINVILIIEANCNNLLLRNHIDFLFQLALGSSNPESKIIDIVDIYSNKSLPDFATRFLTYQLTYLDNGKFNNLIASGKIGSQKLDDDFYNHNVEYAKYTIFLDLFKTAIENGENSLLDFLTTLREGEVLMESLDLQKIDSLNENQVILLNTCLNLVRVLVVNSPYVRFSQKEKIKSLDLSSKKIDDVLKNYQLFRSIRGFKDNENLISNIIRFYLRPLRLKNIEEALQFASNSKKNADLRNKQNSSETLKLEAFDLLKSVKGDLLPDMINLGFYSNEFFSPNDHDSTPGDHDCGEVSLHDQDKSILEIFENNAASKNKRGHEKFNDFTVVIKPGNKYVRYKPKLFSNLKYTYDSSIYEIVDRSVYKNHVGIRTSSPSTDISALYLPSLENIPDLRSEEIFNLNFYYLLFQISNNGFYIPIYNKYGQIVFRIEDINLFQLNKEKYLKVIGQEKIDIEQVFEMFQDNPFISILLNQDAKVSQKITIGEHTSMVLDIFEKFFSDKVDFSFMSREEIRTLLIFHDIGKGWAVLSTGNKTAQHEYTNKVVAEALKSLGTNPRKISLFLDLIDQDLIGDLVRGLKKDNQIALEIQSLCKRHALEPKELLKLLIVLYSSDAGAYTSASGYPSGDLNRIFNLSDMSFSEINEAKVQKIQNLI